MGGLLIVGSGGQGKIAADILLLHGVEVQGFLDDNPASWGTFVLGLPVLGAINEYADYEPDGLVMGIGSNKARRLVAERLGTAAQPLWCNAIHPRAIIANATTIGTGVVIAANAVINSDTILEDFVSLAAGSVVSHDCQIGAYTHIAPGVYLAGNVKVGQGVLLGIGSVITPGHSVGDWAIVGAGAVVVKDVPERVTAKGLPARWEAPVEIGG